MTHPQPLTFGAFYHIYTRGNNREPLFREDRNYAYFLNLYAAHISPIAQTIAYCLLSNHIHFLVRIKTQEEQALCRQASPPAMIDSLFKPKDPSRSFNDLFIAYAKAVNKAYNRTGALFESPFKRKAVTEDSYFTSLIVYIHLNPQKHGLVDDFRTWPYSSYTSLASTNDTVTPIAPWFEGSTDFLAAHCHDGDDPHLADWLLAD